MNRNYFLAAMAAMVLSISGFASAQQDYFNPEIGNGKWSAVQPPISPAYTQYEYFNAEIGNVPKPNTAPAIQRHAGMTGNLELAAATELDNVVLQPGKYQVRHVDTGQEHFVEFSKMVENDYAPEGQSVYESRVVARGNCTMQPLNSIVARTGLQPKIDGATARLEIRGEKVAHLF